MVILLFSILAQVLAIVLLGWLMIIGIQGGRDESLVSFILLSSVAGLSIFTVLSYLMTVLVGFTPIGILLIVLAVDLILLLGLISTKKVNLSFQFRRESNASFQLSKAHLVIAVLTFLAIAFGFLRSMNVALRSATLREIDPWIWLYNTRFLLENGIPDLARAQSYPLGLVYLLGSFSIFDQSYSFTYTLFRFFGPVFSVLIPLAGVVLVTRAFPKSLGAPFVAALLFATSHHLQFQYYLARPETLALFGFIVSLNYIYTRESPSPIIIAILLAGLYLVHPLTCAVLVGMILLIELTRIDILLPKITSKGVVIPAIIAIIMTLPYILFHFSADITSSLGFYFGEYGPASVQLPWAYAMGRLNDLAIRGVGTLLFAVAVYRGLLNIVFRQGVRWASFGMLFFLFWIAFSWLPIIFISNNARRIPSWAVVPLTVLICQVIYSIEERREELSQEEHRISISKRRYLDKLSMRRSTLVVLILATISVSQIAYGLSYTYMGTRYIPYVERATLDYIASDVANIELAYVYESNIYYQAAQAILYPITPVANDSVRKSNYAAIDSWLSQFNQSMAIMTRVGEPLYSYAADMGWAPVFTPDMAFSFGWGEEFLEENLWVFARPVNAENLTLVFHDDFSTTTSWLTNTALDLQSNGTIAYYNGTANPENRTHIYTNIPSFPSQDKVYIVMTLRANTTTLLMQLIGYSGNDRTGDYAFYTWSFRPSSFWKTYGWKPTATPGYTEGPLESISLTITGSDVPWSVLIDEIWIYTLPP